MLVLLLHVGLLVLLQRVHQRCEFNQRRRLVFLVQRFRFETFRVLERPPVQCRREWENGHLLCRVRRVIWGDGDLGNEVPLRPTFTAQERVTVLYFEWD